MWLALVMTLSGCRIETLQNIRDAPIPQSQGHSLTLEDIKAAIMIRHGDAMVRYIMEDVKPGLIHCELNFKTAHKAWVDIPYSTEGYSILYQKSENLHYAAADDEGPAIIKGHYNNWIRALNVSIQRELDRTASGTHADVDAKSRLLKLQELRDSNLITEEEFTTKRARILNAL
ncbi:MAG: SHOCT domain-containing protein [Nitrospirales bacterium]